MISDTTNTVECIDIFSNIFMKYEMNKIGNDVDKLKWSIFSHDINAYYSPQNNEMVFAAAILQKPFFSLDQSFAKNLGGIGTIIAHEISHGFDDQGRKFNKNGNYESWWNEEDVKSFDNLIQPLIKQFDNITLHGIALSGTLTLGENLADYTALTIISDVLRVRNVPLKDFRKAYIAYTEIWKSSERTEFAINMIMTDPHSRPILRVNQILPNIEQFVTLYNIKEGDEMHIPDNEKIKLWN
jgi:putative endopeptidase